MKKSSLLTIAAAISCALAVSGCAKDETAPGTETTPPPAGSVPKEEDTGPKEEDIANATFYLTARMNDTPLIFIEGTEGYESHAVAYKPIINNGCLEIQSMRMARGLDLKKSLEVRFVERAETCKTECSQIKAMYKVGTYNFGRIDSPSGILNTNGVIISYIAPDGKVWSSGSGNADQTGSSFRIVEHKDNSLDSKSSSITTAEFNCKLYDGSGKVIILTHGKIVSRSVNCVQW